MKLVQDLWRALLVFVVATLLLERYAPPSVETRGYSHPCPVNQPFASQTAVPPSVATYAPPPQVYIAPAQTERPLRRVAQSFLDLGDSVIGVIR